MMISLTNNNTLLPLPASNSIFNRSSSKPTIFNRPSSNLSPTSSNRRDDHSLLSTFVSSTTSPLHPHIGNDYLKSNDFAEKGVTFTDIGDGNTAVKMALVDNKTTAKFVVPSGLVTSFKPEMWHGGTMELLHTRVSKGNDNRAVIQGGLSFSLGLEADSWSSSSNNSWALNRVAGDPKESIRVELISSEEKGVELKQVITLGPDMLTSEVIVSNTSDDKSISLRGSVLCHLMVSTPEASYALGLEGTDFFATKPLTEKFSIVPPDFMKRNERRKNPGNFLSLGNIFSRGNSGGEDENVESEVVEVGEEDHDYKHLKEKISRIYTNGPRRLTVMDRGRRNSVIVSREMRGFDEVYLFSPGSSGHEMYGDYSYVCVGHAAVLEPIVVDAQSEWRGGMVLSNPNS